MADSTLWYRTPATRWIEALPVGNGRLGAMVFGGVGNERWQLNEDSLWRGGPEDADNPEALAALPRIRQLQFQGRYAEAQSLCDATVREPSPSGSLGPYTTLGELRLIASNPSHFAGAPAEYRRDLDLATAIATTRYRFGERAYTRRCFASAPDRVIVIALDCTNARLGFRLELSRPGDAQVAPRGPDALLLSGRLGQRDQADGMRFAAMVCVVAGGARVQSSTNGITVDGAEGAMILISAATDYRGADFERQVVVTLETARSKGLAALLARHAADYRPRFERVTLELPRGPSADLATDERLLRSARGEHDPALTALYFQLGRYLLAASSRPGSLAANLQGLWAEGLVDPRNGEHHTRSNLQMSYWLAESGNLPECVEPLVDMILAMQEPGARSARVHYGARGWVVHTLHDVRGFTSPGESPAWGLFPMAAPWLCQHLWEHYAFGGDRAYLRRVWPCIAAATRFCLDWLVHDPESGKLVSGPASSPGSTFVAPGGERCSIGMGPSLDQEILWDHFSNVLAAAAVLGIEDDLVREVRRARADLALPGIGADGRLMEWPLPFAQPDSDHCHISHLFGLHPGRRITPRHTPEEFRAARRTLEACGDGDTGWSRAWQLCFWARLGDGDRALALFRRLLTPVCLEGTAFSADGPGVYPNLLCAHPPFRIDGNLGGAAAIAEMLLQSHDGTIHLLPALPAQWPSGRVSGLRARGGFELELAWRDGALTRARLRSQGGNRCEVRHRARSVRLETISGRDYELSAELCG